MLLQELEYKFSILPDDSKKEIVNLINLIYDSTLTSENSSGEQLQKKISAKYLFSLDKNSRDKILSNQSKIAKNIYDNNPDLILPDLIR